MEEASIYEEIGVTRVINASGSMTYLGGCLMSPTVLKAMHRAAQSFVRIPELMQWAGSTIAEITGAEAGLVTTGASGGMLLAAAACITGSNRGAMRRLPDVRGMKNEVVVQLLHRMHFDQAIRTAGARLVVMGDIEGTQVWELEAAINEHTAAILHVVLDPQPTLALEEVIAIAHARDIPLILDAAAEALPVENLRRFCAMGADLVIFSGGKEIGGPNDTGILCGRQDLIEAATLQAYPNYGIGRPLKVCKEQIVGLITALREHVKTGREAERKRWDAQVAYICERLQEIPGVRAEIAFATGGARPLCIPRVRLHLPERDSNRIEEELDADDPAIAVLVEPEHSTIWLNPQHLREGEEKIVAQSLVAVLDQK